ncbi:MAG TPA: sensor histidine kinase [Actinomycetota bacterium]|nr:sensor histidine kinase [Actinomycetota bacterium]
MVLNEWFYPRRLAVMSFGAGMLALAAAQLASASGRLAGDTPSLHVALDVVEGMIALLIAYLIVGRIRERGLMPDLLSLYALVVLGLSKLLLLGIPTVAAGTRGDLQTWAAPVGRVIGSAVFAIAAVAPMRRVASQRATRVVGLAGLATVFSISVGSALFPTDAPQDSSDPSVLWLHALTAVALALAAAGFADRASRTGDEFFAWFGAGCALGAAARIGYVLLPAVDADDVHVQDFLRVGFYVLLLLGAQRELRLYWQSRADAAALEERRRVARDLHDGLAQELVFIAGQVNRLQRGPVEPAAIEQLSSAADRAVSEARRAIGALTRSVDQTAAEALEELADEFQSRYRVEVRLRLDPGVEMDATRREQVVRIVREAMNNAVRHGSAQVIELALSNDQGPTIEVFDDGVGFDPDQAAPRERGFGLISMRERAQGAGGDLTIDSQVGSGTSVKVRLPSQ